VAIPAGWGTIRSRAPRSGCADATTRLDLWPSGMIVTAIPAQGYGEVRITAVNPSN
jgi:hypothetical protein